MLANIVRFRGYIGLNAMQEFLHRYAGTTIGIFWNIVHPIALIGIFSIVFANIMPTKFRAPGLPEMSFLLFLCSGLLPWLSFVEGLNRCTTTFVENAGYLKKLAVPEEVFAAKAILGALISLAINLTLLFITALVAGHWPTWSWLLTVPAGILMLMFAFGLGLFFGTVNVFVRDVGQIVSIVSQLWLWLTPIAYPIDILPEGLRPFLWINPAYPFIEIFHQTFLFGSWGGWQAWLMAGQWAVLALWLGLITLSGLRGELRDMV
jgi:ABC-type polysaccharide/polyol phosphate export permease